MGVVMMAATGVILAVVIFRWIALALDSASHLISWMDQKYPPFLDL